MPRNDKRADDAQTICWECANAVPDKQGRHGCSWSCERKPVQGWTAKRSRVKLWPGQYINSYCVRECPEFVKG